MKQVLQNEGRMKPTFDSETVHTQTTLPQELSQQKENFWIDMRYYVSKFLGEGSFGAVFLVFDNITREYLALKMPKSKKQIELFHHEISVMNQLTQSDRTGDKPITHLKDYSLANGSMVSTANVSYANDVSYLCTSNATEGDLASHVINNVERYRNGLPESHVFGIFKQLLEGVEFIHKSGFVHLDLKPDNVLLFSQSEVAISDFALSRNIVGEDNQGNFKSYKAGAQQYWSPEMFTDLPYNGVHSDLFALGVTLFIITFG